MASDLMEIFRRGNAPTPSSGQRAVPVPTPTPTPTPRATPTPTKAATPFDLRASVRDALNTFDELPIVNLPDLFSKIPFGSGFYSRLFTGKPTAEDILLLSQATGGGGTDLVNDMAKQLARLYAGVPELQTIPSGAQGTILSSGLGQMSQFGGVQNTILPDVGLGVQPPAGPTASSFLNPAQGAAQLTVDPSQPVTPGEMSRTLGFGSVGVTPEQLGYTIVSLPGGLTLRVPLDEKGQPIPSEGIVYQGRDQFGKYNPVTGKMELTVDASPENLGLAANSGVFETGYVQSLQSNTNSLLKSAQDLAHDQANQGLSVRLKQLEIEVAQGNLTVQKATEQASIAYAEANARKAEADAELATLDLIMAPLTIEEKQLSLHKTRMEIAQSEQKFPLELETAREQLRNSQFERQQKERAAAQTEANNVFARDTYGSLLNMISPGGDTIAGGQADADAAAMAASSSSSGGPPPIFGQLAQGAGTTPSDPAAQAAYAVMMDQLAASGGGQPGVTPAPTTSGVVAPSSSSSASPTPSPTAVPIAAPTPEEIEQEPA